MDCYAYQKTEDYKKKKAKWDEQQRKKKDEAGEGRLGRDTMATLRMSVGRHPRTPRENQGLLMRFGNFLRGPGGRQAPR